MYKHPEAGTPATPPPPTITEKMGAPVATPPRDISLSALYDLMEKNLKWSQIIYEQNRKISRRLLWDAIAQWTRTLVIIIPLAIALWFLPSAYQNVKAKYDALFPFANQQGKSTTTVDDVLKVLPIGDLERQQLKNVLK